MTTTDQELREWYGHNGAECRVKITAGGEVLRHGMPDPTDRSKDTWVWLGRREELVEEIREQREQE